MHILRYIYSKKLQFGTDDQRQIYTLDSAGYTTQTETDVTNDGSIDKVSTYTLNEKGNILQKLDYNRSYDAQGVATDTLTQKEVYGVDTYGYTTSMTRYVGGNSEASVVETYTVNALGQRIRAEIDNYADGSIDTAQIYTLDVYGRISKTENDLANNNSIDSVTYYSRDELGRTTQVEVDSENDGKINTRTSYVLNEYGQVIRDEFDSNNDGTVDRIYEYKYNAVGQRYEVYHDRTANGLTADDSTSISTFNALGQVVIREDYRGDGTLSAYNMFSYDSNGYQYRRETDYDFDKQISSAKDRIVIVSYDKGMGYSIKETVFDGTNKLLYSDSIERNAAGNILRSYRDTLDDGTIEWMEFGIWGGQYTIAHTEDFTTWSNEQLNRLNGMPTITLSNSSASTNIILDKSVIARIDPASNTLTVRGDSTDSVNLKTQSDFTKLDTTKVVSGQTYDQYTTQVDGEIYTLLIDNDIAVTFS